MTVHGGHEVLMGAVERRTGHELSLVFQQGRNRQIEDCCQLIKVMEWN
jgi:uncharacterized protein Veg